MKILELDDIGIKQGVGGIERHVLSLCSMFSNDNEVVLHKPSWSNIRKNKLFKKNYLTKSEIINKLTGYDVVHIHGFMSLMVLQFFYYCKKNNKIVLYSPHFHPFNTLNRPFLGRLFFMLLKPYFKRCSVIFTINDEDTAFFTKYSSNVVRIPHWYSMDTCDTVNNNVKRVDNRILFVGKNTIDKGLDYLYKLPYNKYDVHCVTDGILERKDFIQHTSLNDKELSELYKSASLVVCPSRYEAFSYVVLEALMNGTPVLMSTRVRIADYLKDISGITIFDYGDYNAFLKSIDGSMTAKVDIKKIHSLFDESVIKEMYKKAFKHVCKLADES